MKISRLSAVVIVTLGTTGIAAAGQRQQAGIFRDLVDCRAIADDKARLACYDGKVAAIAQAADAGDVVVADKTQIKEAKRALFGFGSVRLPLLGGSDKNGDAPSEIDAKIVRVRQIGYQKWEFALDNDMTWRQTDDEATYPRAGDTVTIKRAAMGSYMMKVGPKFIRVMRTQ
ncbi:hypothetical protein F9288_20575 [Sphingomonas sp. CL5.1]|uniref:hypothetical protein n=1 Tax=Sphingomonas sp. CL5.1 TaxID=2653203 RepID=UPI0015814124|nr:hypothetical protein [Sphingomonas sp. CL5.1]QKS01742.1 hypothetical protein F9288_20575 [Sphingomonas sp. CL5.1]